MIGLGKLGVSAHCIVVCVCANCVQLYRSRRAVSRELYLIKVQVFPGEFQKEGDLGQGNEGVCKEMIIVRGGLRHSLGLLVN